MKQKNIKHKHNGLMNESYKMVFRALHYFENFLIFISPVSSCVSISAFASWIDVSVGVASPAVGKKTCAITIGVKKYKSVFKRKGQNSVKYHQNLDL